jgi:hypothetical protein
VALSDRQLGRWARTTVRVMLAISNGHKAFWVASALGDQRDLTTAVTPFGTKVTGAYRRRVLEALAITESTWERHVAGWLKDGVAHRCKRATVFLYADLFDSCPLCGQPTGSAPRPRPRNKRAVKGAPSTSPNARDVRATEHETQSATKAVTRSEGLPSDAGVTRLGQEPLFGGSAQGTLFDEQKEEMLAAMIDCWRSPAYSARYAAVFQLAAEVLVEKGATPKEVCWVSENWEKRGYRGSDPKPLLIAFNWERYKPLPGEMDDRL